MGSFFNQIILAKVKEILKKISDSMFGIVKNTEA